MHSSHKTLISFGYAGSSKIAGYTFLYSDVSETNGLYLSGGDNDSSNKYLEGTTIDLGVAGKYVSIAYQTIGSTGPTIWARV